MRRTPRQRCRHVLALLALLLPCARLHGAEPLLPHAPGERVTGVAPVHGLAIAYDVIGVGRPTLYLHPILSHRGLVHDLPPDRQWILVDRQGHGRTPDRDGPITCEQDADDAAGLLASLGIAQADVVGVSFGGAIAVTLAVRHPTVVRRVVCYGSTLAPLPRAAAATLSPEAP